VRDKDNCFFFFNVISVLQGRDMKVRSSRTLLAS
jgi:hypothetical protein